VEVHADVDQVHDSHCEHDRNNAQLQSRPMPNSAASEETLASALRFPARWRDAWQAWRDARALAARVYPRGAPRFRRRRLAFEWSAALHGRAHRALAAFFADEPWRPIVQAHPQLLQKIHKPFACRGLDVDARAALVRRHYELARERIGPALLEAVAGRRDLLLCSVPLPNGHGELTARLGKQPRFEREGELTLTLHDPFGSLLYSTCFTLRECDGEVGLLVGSLNGTAPRDVLRHLTKLAWGLRPQSLLVFLLQQVAAQVGAQRIDAVGRASHAYWGNPRHDEIRFDYDAFWREEGGVETAESLHALPLRPRRRTTDEIPRQKRALYARRYAWLDTVAADVARGWAEGFGGGRRAAATNPGPGQNR
jgi:uncharacterized protein VirK/YbjX